MSQFFNTLFRDFGNFFSGGHSFSTLEFYLYPCVSLIVVFILAFILLKLPFLNKSNVRPQKVFFIFRSFILSSFIVILGITILISISWAMHLYVQHKFRLEGSHLLSLIIVYINAIIWFLVLRGYYTRRDFKEICKIPITYGEERRQFIAYKKLYRLLKIFLILPFFGFFALFAMDKGKNLVSIVFDNSGTMGSAPFYNQGSQSSKWVIAKNALRETFSNLGTNNQIVITTIEESQNNIPRVFLDIINTTDPDKIRGKNAFYATPKDALNDFERFIWPSSQIEGSPLAEITWKNFLFSRELSTKYNNKVLIIISDGQENCITGTNPFPSFFCHKPEFSTFYSSITFIDIEGAVTKGYSFPFYNAAQNCGYRINDGSSLSNYLFALKQILFKFQQNWSIIIWTLFFIVFFSIIILAIKPKNLV